MSRLVWSVEKLKEAAAQYRTRQEFVKGNLPAYGAAQKRQLLDIVCEHMEQSITAKMTHNQYISIVPETIECLETYSGMHTKILHKCKTCNHEWSTKPMNIRSGRSCPKCAIARNAKSLSESKRYTREQYINLIPQFTLIGEYQGIHVKSLHRCNQCSHEWLVKPTITLRGYDCPKRCTKPDDHIKELFEKFGDDVRLVKWNSNSSTKAEYICSKNHTFHIMPKDMIRMQGCRRCTTNGVSVPEQILCSFVENLGFTIERNTRSIINPKELDIYIPAKKIAIEFNGTYWHSQHPPIYHLNKTIDCEKLGIHLIHVWEHEFDNPIMRSIIANALGCCARTYYARECNIKYLAWNEARDFLNTHHIQGAGAATNHNIALCYGDEIIAVMTFGKPRFQPITTEWELIRYAVAMDTHTIGGAARLWSKRPTGSIVTYSDRRLFTGQLYERLGFDRGHASAPGYFYIGREGQIMSRYKAQRKKLPELLGSQFNAELSEAKNMENAGYVKIHDCGIIRWTYDM